MAKFRPPQQVLDVFWLLSDGNDDQRSAGAVKLASLIKTCEDSERNEIVQYCLERLIRGLSSGRRFARVGFAVALAQLLRDNKDIKTKNVLSTVKEKLKFLVADRKSKFELGGIYLGKAFAISALIQAGRVDQLGADDLPSLLNELFKIGDKKSHLKTVCDAVIQSLILQVQADLFKEHVWPNLKGRMKSGWTLCSLDKLALLLACRGRFPEVVKKKFLRKHWGLPVLNETNDSNLLAAVLTSGQRSEIFVEQILPEMLASDREPVSIWKAIGEKLMEEMPEGKTKIMRERQLFGLKIASKLVSGDISSDQVLEIMLSPGLAKYLFHPVTKKNDPLLQAADSLCHQMCQKLSGHHASVLPVLESIWKLEAILLEQEHSGRIEIVKSNNVIHLVDLMSKDEAESYSQLLIAMVMGKDKWQVMSHDLAKKLKQTESCLFHLQHLASSQLQDRLETRQSILALFLRLAFFHVTKETSKIEHCESCVNIVEEAKASKLSQALFFRVLDNLFTQITGQQKKWEQLSSCLDLLYRLADYVQDLLKTQKVVPVGRLPSQVKSEWPKLVDFCKKIKQTPDSEKLESAFALSVLFLGFHMMTDAQVAVELLQDVYICYEKAKGTEESDITDEGNEPQWVDVMMDVLLKLMSLNSHLARVVAGSVFRLLSDHVTPTAVALITEVLVPNKSDGAVLVEAGNDEDDTGDDELVDDDESPENGSIDEEDSKSDENDDNNMADDQREEIESLPDLSDSEMFQMDAMLAEVFKHRKKSSGKKAREEKKQGLINFQVRVLDLAEILIKGDRCGDFVLNLLKPLVCLILKSGSTGFQVLVDRAKSLFSLIKSKAQGLKDYIHSEDDYIQVLTELFDLAKKATEKKHIQEISAACHILMTINLEQQTVQDRSRSYVQLLKTAVEKIISKKSSKPPVTFFTSLIEIDPRHFQKLGTDLVNRLKEESARPPGRMICCMILASLCKKMHQTTEPEVLAMKQWMREAAQVVTQLILSLDKPMYYKEVLTLTLALQVRQDIFLSEVLFGDDIKDHLLKVKSKFNTDIRRLANKIIASIDKENCQPRPAQKRAAAQSDMNITMAKRKKNQS